MTRRFMNVVVGIIVVVAGAGGFYANIKGGYDPVSSFASGGCLMMGAFLIKAGITGEDLF